METTVYTKCLRNHASRIGMCANDGCLEYYAIPDSFMCGACGCHRSFHEKKAMVQHEPLSGPIVVVNDEQQEVKGRPPVPVRRHVRNTIFRPTEPQEAAMKELGERCGWDLHNERMRAVRAFCESQKIKFLHLKTWIRINRNQRNH